MGDWTVRGQTLPCNSTCKNARPRHTMSQRCPVSFLLVAAQHGRAPEYAQSRWCSASSAEVPSSCSSAPPCLPGGHVPQTQQKGVCFVDQPCARAGVVLYRSSCCSRKRRARRLPPRMANCGGSMARLRTASLCIRISQNVFAASLVGVMTHGTLLLLLRYWQHGRQRDKDKAPA